MEVDSACKEASASFLSIRLDDVSEKDRYSEDQLESRLHTSKINLIGIQHLKICLRKLGTMQ